MPRLRLPLLPARVRWAGVLAVAAVIFYFSVITVPAGVPEPGPLWDKQLHLVASSAFTLVLAYATARSTLDSWKRVLVVVGVAIGYGAGIELVQAFVPARSFSPGDIVANVLGVALASVWFRIEPAVDYLPLRAGRS